MSTTDKSLLCPRCGHHLHQPIPGPCQWYDCRCGHPTRSPDSPDPLTAALWGFRWTGDAAEMAARLRAELNRMGYVISPRSPDSVRTPDLDVERLLLADAVTPISGQQYWSQSRRTYWERFADAYRAALHPASPLDEDRDHATGGSGSNE